MKQNRVTDKESLNKLNKLNKVMLRETLEKLHMKLNDKSFRKEFTNLFLEYLDVNNRDTNAHYHKILKLLEDAGFNREEAEDFFKDIRVNNKETIIKLSKLQSQIEKADEQYKSNKWKIMANPLNLKNIAVLYLNVYQELEAEFKKMKEELFLKFKINQEMKNKLKKIEKILGNNIKNLDKIAKGEEFLILNKAHKDANDIKEVFESFKAELLKDDFTKHYVKKAEEDVTQDVTKMNSSDLIDVEDEINKINNKDKNQVENNDLEEKEILIDEKETLENPNDKENDLKKDLDNCLKVVMNDLDNVDNLDKKTMSFYVLSEYLHSYNKADYKDLYKEFKDVLNTEEFSSIIVANKAVMNNDLSYERLEKIFQESGLAALIKMMKDFMEKDKEEGKKYAELYKQVEEKITGKKDIGEKEINENEKELGSKEVKRKTKSLSIDF